MIESRLRRLARTILDEGIEQIPQARNCMSLLWVRSGGHEIWCELLGLDAELYRLRFEADWRDKAPKTERAPVHHAAYRVLARMKHGRRYRIAQLSKMIGITPMSVRRNIDQLIDEGLVEREKIGREFLIWRK